MLIHLDCQGSGVVVVIDTKEWEHETHMKHAKDRVVSEQRIMGTYEWKGER